MEELQVPVRRIAVEVVVTTGARVHGSLFVHGSPYQSGDPEEVLELLNDERRFLPLAVDDGPGMFVVNKEHVVRVHLRLSSPGLVERWPDAVPIDAAECRLFLADGSRVSGRVLLQTPSSSSRTVDKLNRCGPFILLAGAEGLDFIRTSHVVHVA